MDTQMDRHTNKSPLYHTRVQAEIFYALFFLFLNSLHLLTHSILFGINSKYKK